MGSPDSNNLTDWLFTILSFSMSF